MMTLEILKFVDFIKKTQLNPLMPGGNKKVIHT